MPSTAESTEMAGVITPSPKKMAVPKMPRASNLPRKAGLSFTAVEASVSMATRPPSPLLSARRISVTYFSDTITVRVQNIIDKMP